MPKKLFILFILVLLAIWSCGLGNAFSPITNYQPIFKPFLDTTNTLQIAIRQYEYNGISMLLVVNPYTLKTQAIPRHKVDFKAIPKDIWKTTPFIQALERHTGPPYPTANDGVTDSDTPSQGVFLTVDMCPSLRDFEKKMFEVTGELPQSKKEPVPIAISITGAWLNNHNEELQWLLKQEAEGRLEITWINHSYSHPYDKDKPYPYTDTFLLTPGLDVEQEILGQEKLMLSQGLTPSVFFRFPGLISDRHLIEMLRNVSLIPVGSNAWLAKREKVRHGSIILVHGNGNEPSGIELLLAYYRENQVDLENGKLFLQPLRTAFRSVVK